MFRRITRVSKVAASYLRRLPTNIAIERLRADRGSGRSMLAAFICAIAYLAAMGLCVVAVGNGGPGWLYVLVVLFFWNGLKFAWLVFLVGFRNLALRCPPGKSTR